jgi:hypothetical protein
MLTNRAATTCGAVLFAAVASLILWGGFHSARIHLKALAECGAIELSAESPSVVAASPSSALVADDGDRSVSKAALLSRRHRSGLGRRRTVVGRNLTATSSLAESEHPFFAAPPPGERLPRETDPRSFPRSAAHLRLQV